MNPLDWLYYAAAAWFVAYAVTKTSGPFHVFVLIREFGGGRWHGRTMKWVSNDSGDGRATMAAYTPEHNGLLDCIICLMPYVALVLRLIGQHVLIDALAIAGVALWLHGFTGWRHDF